MVNQIAWLSVGALSGWLAGLMLRNEGLRAKVLDIVVGMLGATLAGVLLSPLVGASMAADGAFHVGAIAVALLGAVTLVVVFKMVRGVVARH